MIKIADNKIRWAISAVLALLILFGTYRNVFSLAAFLGLCLIIFFFDKESILLQLFFIMPMANIFKLSPGVQSFFTILLLAYVAIHLILPRKATMLVIFFAIYIVVGELLAGQFNLFRTIKLVCNILFLSSVLNSEVHIRHKEIFLSYINGNVIASIFGMLDSSVFRIESYVGTAELETTEFGEDLTRFVGLYSDPNYYAIGMIVSLCLLVILLHRNEISPIVPIIYTVPIVYFLIQTYSKSAIIMLLVPFGFLLYSLGEKKMYITALLLVVAGVTVIILALTGQISALEIVLARMSAGTTGSEVDVNALTTGRFDLWIIYMKYIVKNIKTILFGDGITAALINGRASHNTYLDIIYHLGLAGGIILIFSLRTILSQSIHFGVKRNIMNYSVLICILIMYFFLGELFYYDPPFQIFLAFTVLNLPLKKSRKTVNTEKHDYSYQKGSKKVVDYQ